ncbi:hypothetical protein ILYODFUR_007594 [Ilyodon furcidens]|uniref:Uncharacterized protein n=1 Tax=Ilyodon furcidens TaxID=33524 RepID=A0ABV0TJ92_9TELE
MQSSTQKGVKYLTKQNKANSSRCEWDHTSSYGKNDNMRKGCGGEGQWGAALTVTQFYSVIKPPPTLEQRKSYKTFGGKLTSSEVEDKENGEFHHEVILTVHSHSAPALALRCSTTPQNTHKAG